MKRILLSVLLALSAGIECETSIQLDVLYYNIQVEYAFHLPVGYNKTKSFHVKCTDVGGVGYIYYYNYDDGSTLYISNASSPSPYTKQEQEIVGSVLTIILEEDPNRCIEQAGYIDGSGYYRDRQSHDICIGYYNVSEAKKEEFDRAINSLRAVKQL